VLVSGREGVLVTAPGFLCVTAPRLASCALVLLASCAPPLCSLLRLCVACICYGCVGKGGVPMRPVVFSFPVR
jgi:hypothetical protein